MARFEIHPTELKETSDLYNTIASEFETLSRRLNTVSFHALVNPADQTTRIAALNASLERAQADAALVATEIRTDGDLMSHTSTAAINADSVASLDDVNHRGPWAAFSAINNPRQVIIHSPKSWNLIVNSGPQWRARMNQLNETRPVLRNDLRRLNRPLLAAKAYTLPRVRSFIHINKWAGTTPDLIDVVINAGSDSTFLRRVSPAATRFGNRLAPGLGHTTTRSEAGRLLSSRFVAKSRAASASTATLTNRVTSWTSRRITINHLLSHYDLNLLHRLDQGLTERPLLRRLRPLTLKAGHARVQLEMAQVATLNRFGSSTRQLGTTIGSQLIPTSASAAGRSAGSLWHGASRMVDASRSLDGWITQSSRAIASSRARFASSKLGAIAKASGRKLGGVGVILDLASMNRSFEERDFEGVAVSGFKALGGTLLLFPGGQAAGAIILGGALIYENREALTSGARWLGRSTKSAGEWAGRKLADGATKTAKAAANTAQDMITDITSPLKALSGLFGGG